MTKANATTQRVVIYVRISKDRPDQTSTQTQLAEAMAFAKHKGWEVIEVCADEGKSAFKRNVRRPAFIRAMRLIETGQANVFLVWKLDRFYRGLDEFNQAWGQIRNANGHLVSVTEPTYDTTSNDPMIKWAIMGFAAMAEAESVTKSHRSKSNHRLRIAEGRIPNGPRPFGYNKVGNRFEFNEQESAFIRDAAQRILNGESIRSILKSTSLTSPSGKQLSAHGLRSILTAPRTAGYRRDPETGTLIDGQFWEPILDREKWDALIALFGDPERATHSNGTSLVHVLTGLMVCGREGCGGVIGSRCHKDGPRYSCRNCGNSIGESVADTVVRMKVLELCPQSEWESMTTRGRGFDPSVVQPLESRIEELTIDQMVETDPKRRAMMQKAIDRLTEQVAAATDGDWLDLPNVTNLANEWDSMSMDDMRKAIRHIAPVITLAPVKGATKDPMRRINVEGK